MARPGEKARSSRAGSNWRKLQKVLAPSDGSAPRKSRRSYDNAVQERSYLDKGKGRAIELVQEDNTNGTGSRGSSSSPAPTNLPWFAEDLSPEDLALVRTNSESAHDRSRLRRHSGPSQAADDAADGTTSTSESEHRKLVILGGDAALTKEKMEAGTYVAIDCEMVGVGPNGSESVLARVSIVNWHGATLLDTFVRPQERVTDYRTWVSGVRSQDLQGAPSFTAVQQQVADLIKGRVLVGHAIHNDLSALLLSHPRPMIRDTASFQACRDLAKTKFPSLRKLVALKLGIDIQKRGQEHSSVEDARATMALYRTLHADWQKSLLTHGKVQGAKSGKLKRSPSNGSDAAILYPGWKGKRAASSMSNGADAGDKTAHVSKGRVHKAPRRSKQPDDPEWWAKV